MDSTGIDHRKGQRFCNRRSAISFRRCDYSRRGHRFLADQFLVALCNENKFEPELFFMRVKNNPYVIKYKCKQIQEIKNANNNRD